MANKNKANALVSNLGIWKSSSTKQETKEVAEPRPSVEAGCKEGDARTTIILNKDLMRKVKFIALADGSTIKDKVSEALQAVVESWEAEQGINAEPITLNYSQAKYLRVVQSLYVLNIMSCDIYTQHFL